MRAILIASSIKFNFQLGLCDNLHNDVFIFSVTLHFGMEDVILSAQCTDTTHITPSLSSFILHIQYPCMCPLYTIYVHNIAQSKSQPKRFSLYHSFTSMEQRWLKMVGTRVGMRKQNNYTNIYIQLWSILQIKNWYVMFTWKSDKNSKFELGTEAKAAFNSLFMVAAHLADLANSFAPLSYFDPFSALLAHLDQWYYESLKIWTILANWSPFLQILAHWTCTWKHSK